MSIWLGRACDFLLGAAIAACAAHAAAATELQTRAAPEQKPAWAGFYLEQGLASSNPMTWANQGASGEFSSFGLATPSVNESFGYNFRSGNFVFGLEGSLAAANFDGRFTSAYFPEVAGWSPNMNWLGTVTGRVGYSFGQWMPYVKGGFAAADVASPLQDPLSFSTTSSERVGWTAGAGLEYQLTPKWSLGLEYLYTDLGAGTGSGPVTPLGSPSAGSPGVYSTALKSQSLLGRLNYKTGW